jgi:hypothetical protein
MIDTDFPMPKYYVVTTLSSTTSERFQTWKYMIRSYEHGKLVLETVHASEISLDVECHALESRGFVHWEENA